MTRPLQVLDLYSGKEGWSQAFSDRGHRVATVDIEKRFKPTIRANVRALTADQLTPRKVFTYAWQRFRSRVEPVDNLPDRWDLILGSPPCQPFSTMSWGHYWENGKPATARTRAAITLLQHTLNLFRALQPRAWVLENPRGMMRTRRFMAAYVRSTVTYCQYGMDYQKPTDLWGIFPPTWEPRDPCDAGDPCHEYTPRLDQRRGLAGVKDPADRALVPYQLSEELCVAMENWQDDHWQPPPLRQATLAEVIA